MREIGAEITLSHARISGILGHIWHGNVTKKRLSVYGLLRAYLLCIIQLYGPFGTAERDHILLTEVHYEL